jgi:uncharacterized protein (TIGR00266 family)
MDQQQQMYAQQQGMQPQQPGMGAPMGAPPQQAGIPHEITHGPSFALLRVDLQPGQRLATEAGSMVARSSNIKMDVKMSTKESMGFFSMIFTIMLAFVRKVMGGESFFVNHFYGAQPGSVWIAPTMAGEITYRRINPGDKLILSAGAYLASVGDIDVKMKFGGLKSMLAKEGAFMLEVTGNGDLWFNSYGGTTAIDINGPFMVDNGHFVAYEGQLTFNLRSAGGGMLGFLAGGEGLVCEFNGQGKVYIQSRNTQSLIGWLTPMLPQR